MLTQAYDIFVVLSNYGISICKWLTYPFTNSKEHYEQQRNLLDHAAFGQDDILRGCEGSENGKKYLVVTENSINGGERKRTTIRIFAESIEPFKLAINEAATAAQQ
jgi:hypothetical protein